MYLQVYGEIVKSHSEDQILVLFREDLLINHPTVKILPSVHADLRLDQLNLYRRGFLLHSIHHRLLRQDRYQDRYQERYQDHSGHYCCRNREALGLFVDKMSNRVTQNVLRVQQASVETYRLRGRQNCAQRHEARHKSSWQEPQRPLELYRG